MAHLHITFTFRIIIILNFLIKKKTIYLVSRKVVDNFVNSHLIRRVSGVTGTGLNPNLANKTFFVY